MESSIIVYDMQRNRVITNEDVAATYGQKVNVITAKYDAVFNTKLLAKQFAHDYAEKTGNKVIIGTIISR